MRDSAWSRSANVAGARVDLRQLGPVGGGELRLLGELAARALELGLALVVERARRDLQQRVLLDRLARLGDEIDELVIVGEDRDRAGWPMTCRSTSVPSVRR